jgi:serine protease
MASPHVAGLAALIASDGVTGPAQIRARLHQGADDLGEAGTDPAYGKGRINVARSLGL